MNIPAPSANILLSPKVTLRYLFFTFLKIGMVSFGGHMALVSVIKNVMTDRDKTLNHEVILDAVGIGTLLPGPLAVNVVAYIGYHLKNKRGALVSITGVILPACTAMLILSWAYFAYGYHQQFKEVMYYVTGAVSAIILSTGLQLYTKELKGNTLKTLLCVASIIAIWFTKSFLFTIACIVAGGVLGSVLKMGGKNISVKPKQKLSFFPGKISSIVLAILICTVLLFVFNAQQYVTTAWLKIIMIFSGISLSLFGGGYVMIPIMQSLFVTDLAWLTKQEFLDAIAFSQSTPGPILVSATFIGYKLSGLGGALLATVSIFSPSAILMILVSKVYMGIKDQPNVKNILAGIKAVVIGLIIGSAVSIARQAEWNVVLAIITAAAFIGSFRFKISPVYIIVGAGLTGWIITYFSS